MFGRRKQENWFEYLDEQFALDVLADYATQPDDPDRLVVILHGERCVGTSKLPA